MSDSVSDTVQHIVKSETPVLKRDATRAVMPNMQSKPSLVRQGTQRMSLVDIVKVKGAVKKPQSILKDERIPWYLIDPTGERIAEQREILKRLKRLNSPERDKPLHERLLDRCWPPPPLFPFWDLVTASALVFTAVRPPHAPTSPMHSAVNSVCATPSACAGGHALRGGLRAAAPERL